MKRLGNFEMIFIGILFLIIVMHIGCSCRSENYTNMLTYSDAYSPAPNPKSWEQPNLLITPSNPLPQGVVDILSRPNQPIPLPEGEMDMFATTSFSPSCCPNSYSTSSGCACMTMGQYKYLTERGGNNVPPEF